MKIILIGGKARSGKDTSAEQLKIYLEKKNKSVLIIHYADLLKYIAKEFFDWDGKKDLMGRQLLQYIGTDVVRKKNENFWVSYVVNFLKVFNAEWDYVIIPDTRFPNEIDIMKKEFPNSVYSILITRENNKQELTEEQMNHPSETSVEQCDFDYEIKNDGKKKDLLFKLIDFLRI